MGIEDWAVANPYGIAKLTLNDFKVELKERGLSVTGLKSGPKEQLVQYMIESSGIRDDIVEDNGLGKAVV